MWRFPLCHFIIIYQVMILFFFLWLSDDSGRAVDVKFFAGAWKWQSKTTKFKIGHQFLPLQFFQRIPTTRQRHSAFSLRGLKIQPLCSFTTQCSRPLSKRVPANYFGPYRIFHFLFWKTSLPLRCLNFPVYWNRGFGCHPPTTWKKTSHCGAKLKKTTTRIWSLQIQSFTNLPTS